MTEENSPPFNQKVLYTFLKHILRSMNLRQNIRKGKPSRPKSIQESWLYSWQSLWFSDPFEKLFGKRGVFSTTLTGLVSCFRSHQNPKQLPRLPWKITRCTLHIFFRRINDSGNSDQRLWTPHRKCPSLSDVYRVMLPHTTTDIYHDVSINHTYSMINQFT